MADPKVGQRQQEGVAGRVITNLANQLDLRPSGGRSMRDLDRPARRH
jgi:hypothetical protein